MPKLLRVLSPWAMVYALVLGVTGCSLMVPGENRDTDAATDSETETAKDSETDTAADSETETAKDSETDTDTDSETDTAIDSETDTAADSETDTATDSETGTGSDTETVECTEPSQCQGEDTLCSYRTCIDFKCGMANADQGTSCGLCQSCDGDGNCDEVPADDSDCGDISCSGLNTACTSYNPITTDRCAALGTCKTAAAETCTNLTHHGSSKKCGLCSVCDGAGNCDEVPADDVNCGSISCSGLDTTCTTYNPITTNRCASLGTCKTAAAETCTNLTHHSSSKKCGLCSVCDGAGNCDEVPADDADCGSISCSGLNTDCTTYNPIATNRCASLGTCKTASEKTCTNLTYQGSNKKCGLCSVCDGAGNCDEMPADDEDCGVLACSKLSTSCRTYIDKDYNRCQSLGTCKSVSASTCTTFVNAKDTTSCGLCSLCDGDGNCDLMPADDVNCGTVKCSTLSTDCRIYGDLTTNRCASLGACKSVTKGNCPNYADSPTSQKCDTGLCHRCDGAGTCVANSTTHVDCATCKKCSSGSCVNQAPGEDLKGECDPEVCENDGGDIICVGLVCTDYISGWLNNACYAYPNTHTALYGACRGNGTCADTPEEQCTGRGALTASCSAAGCKRTNKCAPGTLVVDNNSVSEVCYTSCQQACAAGYHCSGTGSCVVDECTVAADCTTMILPECSCGVCVETGSCPILYAWEEDTFEFESDLFGPGHLGLKMSTGFKKPYPHDNYLLESLPTAKEGVLEMRLVEEREEINYLDSMQLYAVDAPEGADIVSEIVFITTSYLPPDELLHTVSTQLQNPVSLTLVNTGEDVSDLLQKTDKNFLVLSNDRNTDFDWHTIELDLGDISQAPMVKLVIDAQSVFPSTPVGYERMRNLDESGFTTRIEVLDENGDWVVVPRDIVVLPKPKEFRRKHVVDITEAFLTDSGKVRISYLMKTYIDSVQFDTTEDLPIEVTPIDLVSAELRYYGKSAISTSEEVFEYVYGVPAGTKLVVMPGNYTRYGDVMPLLDENDDKFVIFGAKDEIALQFSAPEGITTKGVRRFLLYTNGYYKSRKNTFIDHQVEPLPFAAMSNFPYVESKENYPYDDEHIDYLSTWNTRVITPE